MQQSGDDERRGVEPEHQRERAAEQVGARQRGDEREERGAERDRAVRRAEHEAVRERQVVVVDEIGDRRVAAGQEHEARDLER